MKEERGDVFFLTHTFLGEVRSERDKPHESKEGRMANNTINVGDFSLNISTLEGIGQYERLLWEECARQGNIPFFVKCLSKKFDMERNLGICFKESLKSKQVEFSKTVLKQWWKCKKKKNKRLQTMDDKDELELNAIRWCSEMDADEEIFDLLFQYSVFPESWIMFFLKDNLHLLPLAERYAKDGKAWKKTLEFILKNILVQIKGFSNRDLEMVVNLLHKKKPGMWSFKQKDGSFLLQAFLKANWTGADILLRMGAPFDPTDMIGWCFPLEGGCFNRIIFLLNRGAIPGEKIPIPFLEEYCRYRVTLIEYGNMTIDRDPILVPFLQGNKTCCSFHHEEEEEQKISTWKDYESHYVHYQNHHVLYPPWSIQRLIWIANIKGSMFSKLPVELITLLIREFLTMKNLFPYQKRRLHLETWPKSPPGLLFNYHLEETMKMKKATVKRKRDS